MFQALLITLLLTITPPHEMKKSVYEFKVPSLSGATINFADFKGKKILVVNTASLCGFTPQYADLEKLYKRFKNKLVIVGFPANNFKQQEPGTNKEISEFCTTKYHITFPMAAKVSVKGDDTAPIYQWLEATAMKQGLTPAVPQWNFHKYLLDEKGNLVAVFASAVNPMDDKVIAAVVK